VAKTCGGAYLQQLEDLLVLGVSLELLDGLEAEQAAHRRQGRNGLPDRTDDALDGERVHLG
jgi:hypothetical protein